MVLEDAERALEGGPLLDALDPFLLLVMTREKEPELIGDARAGRGGEDDAPDRQQPILREHAAGDRDCLALDAGADEYRAQPEAGDQGFKCQAALLDPSAMA